ncbi:MAG: fimbrillin family protein, partial [Rikenellaceae bacterium]|nr:fimbrillin family protein [Rikenellaceae bacterium]
TNDILVAYPASGLALENEDAEVSLTFKHKMHTLRMFVPDDVEGMGEPIRRIDITFPTPVVGDVSVDYTSATAPATLANGSNTVSVEIPEGLSASSEEARKYAYAIVFPATMNESDQITFTVSTDNYRSVQSFGARSLSEGGSTPVRLTCSPDNRTLLRFTIKDNFLGENPTKVTFTAAIGEAVADCATTFDKFGYYDLDVTDLEGLAGQPITVTYESESAIVTQSLTLPNYEAGKLTKVDLTVPYLLYEDFSGMSAFENNTYEFGAFNYNPSAISLDSYGLAGWSGARIGGGANTNIRIACRYESGIGVAASYKGRCDSRPLSQIKEGKSVKLNVSYNYAADLHEEMGSGGSVTFWAGTTTTSGNIKGDVGITNVVLGESVLATDGPMAKGSWYGNTPHTQTYTVSGCGSTTRLSWRVGTNRGGSIAGRGYYWLYIDNVKVSIAK